MAKQAGGKERETAKSKLADARAKLKSVEEKLKRITKEGEQEVERARQSAAKRLATITKEVERRTTRRARAEAKLASLDGKQGSRKKKKAPTEAPIASAQAAADHLKEIQNDALQEQATSPVVSSTDLTTIAAPESDHADTLDRYAQRSLSVLHESFSVNGATFTEWLAAVQLSKRTFLRARRALVDAGLVVRDGDGQGAKYVVTDAGVAGLK